MKVRRLLKLPAMFVLFYDAHTDLKMQVFFLSHYCVIISVRFNLVIQFKPFLYQGLYDIDLMHASSLVIYTT